MDFKINGTIALGTLPLLQDTPIFYWVLFLLLLLHPGSRGVRDHEPEGAHTKKLPGRVDKGCTPR